MPSHWCDVWPAARRESVSPSHYALLLRQRMEAAYHPCSLSTYCPCNNVNKSRIVVHCDCLKPHHGRESATPAPPETVTPTTPTDQSDPVTPPDYEDELVYPSPPVQTSPEPSLRRLSRIRRPDRFGDPVAHYLTCEIGIVSRPCLSISHDLDCLAVIMNLTFVYCVAN